MTEPGNSSSCTAEKGGRPGVTYRFGHLVTYGASYYSYPYAKFIASAIWERNFAEDPFCKQAG